MAWGRLGREGVRQATVHAAFCLEVAGEPCRAPSSMPRQLVLSSLRVQGQAWPEERVLRVLTPHCQPTPGACWFLPAKPGPEHPLLQHILSGAGGLVHPPKALSDACSLAGCSRCTDGPRCPLSPPVSGVWSSLASPLGASRDCLAATRRSLRRGLGVCSHPLAR